MAEPGCGDDRRRGSGDRNTEHDAGQTELLQQALPSVLPPFPLHCVAGMLAMQHIVRSGKTLGCC